ncbi:MAG: hypothetical protein KDB04_17925 [Acidimicrobiales bacterium]|nr:hypothetical protein [Acidimicrobiales bacterium]HRW37077.1 hypothetical protein [Aquihabitans sp.]
MSAPAASERRPRPSLVAVGGWLLLAGAATALDGLVGLAVAVLVAAVLLAGGSPRSLGALGVAALASVPIVVLGRGLPSDDEVSPFFVAGSLWPHHLAFGGLVLVGAWAVLDLGHQLRHAPPDAVPAVPGRPPLRVAVVLVAIVALGALAASVAVLRT